MRASDVIALVGLLITLAALPAGAQQLAPAAVRAADNTTSVGASSFSADTTALSGNSAPAHEPIHTTGTVVGGLIGGGGGLVVGVLVGAQLARGCHGELCGLSEAAFGGLVGESLGLAIGAHLGSGSTSGDRLILSSLTSVGIVTGGVLASLAGGVVVLPLTPVLQLAAAYAIESH